MSEKNSNQKKNSKLENFKLFYEHTDDNRVILNKQSRKIRTPTRTTASRR